MLNSIDIIRLLIFNQIFNILVKMYICLKPIKFNEFANDVLNQFKYEFVFAVNG